MSIEKETKRLSKKNKCETMEDIYKTTFCVHICTDEKCL